jgi:hypothetical protein
MQILLHIGCNLGHVCSIKLGKVVHVQAEAPLAAAGTRPWI